MHETMQRIFDATKKSPNELALAINVAPQSITNWSKRGISKSGAIAVAEKFGMSFDWIFTGNGQTVNKANQVTEKNVIQRLFRDNKDNSGLIAIPYYDVVASCGSGRFNNDASEILGYYEVSEQFLATMNLPVNGKGLILINASGDSMYPSIPDKTTLLVNTLELEFDRLANGKVYVFNANGSMICKRVYRNLDGTITLRSDNPDKSIYPDQPVNQDNFDVFNICGRVKYAFLEF